VKNANPADDKSFKKMVRDMGSEFTILGKEESVEV
jgi:hypothetical protein